MLKNKKILGIISFAISIAIGIIVFSVCASRSSYAGLSRLDKKSAKSYEEVTREYMESVLPSLHIDGKIKSIHAIRYMNKNDYTNSISPFVKVSVKTKDKNIDYMYNIFSEELYTNEFYADIMSDFKKSFYKSTGMSDKVGLDSFRIVSDALVSELAVGSSLQTRLPYNNDAFLPVEITTYKELKNNTELNGGFNVYINIDYINTIFQYQNYNYEDVFSFKPKYGEIIFTTKDEDGKEIDSSWVKYEKGDILINYSNVSTSTCDGFDLEYDSNYAVSIIAQTNSNRDTVVKDNFVYTPISEIYSLSVIKLNKDVENEQDNSLGGKTRLISLLSDKVKITFPSKYCTNPNNTYVIDMGDGMFKDMRTSTSETVELKDKDNIKLTIYIKSPLEEPAN